MGKASPCLVTAEGWYMHSEFNGLLYLSPDKRINLLSTLQRRIRAFKYHYEYLGITLRGKMPLKVVFHPLPFFLGREGITSFSFGMPTKNNSQLQVLCKTNTPEVLPK